MEKIIVNLIWAATLAGIALSYLAYLTRGKKAAAADDLAQINRRLEQIETAISLKQL